MGPVCLNRSASSDGPKAAGVEEARRRGIVTHRILELLDFSRCSTAADVAAQIGLLVQNKKILPDEGAFVDTGGILWFLTRTEVGARVRRAAGQKMGVRREIPFTSHAFPPVEAEGTTDPADWPTIRGTIDLLLVDAIAKSPEIIDYKTDSAFTWEKNLPVYERQMQYYLSSSLGHSPLPRQPGDAGFPRAAKGH